MKVCKFGGSSVASAAQISKICDIIQADAARRIVVVSAPGKRNKSDAKVTDLLIACAEARIDDLPADDVLEQVIERYSEICRDLGLPQETVQAIKDNLTETVMGSTEHAGRYLDAVKAAGEDNCARLVAGELRRRGADARYLNPGDAGLLLSDEYGNARLLPESQDNLAKLRDSEGIIVFPGFFGYTPDGEVVTFPRGGSDITGSILAAAVEAEVYENFTDVDSVLAADPGIVPNAAPVPEITFREMRELSYAGFGVLHDEAIIPAVRSGIPICIKNTNAPDQPGTMIVPEHIKVASRVVGTACSAGFCTIYVRKYLMNREIGFGRRLLQIFEEEGLSFEHTPSGIDDMSVIIREKYLSPEVEKTVVERIRNELNPDSVLVEHGLALLMVVGEGMRQEVGLATKITKAFADAGVNIEMINQGSSEISMMFGIKAEDSERAIISLHKALFEETD